MPQTSNKKPHSKRLKSISIHNKSKHLNPYIFNPRIGSTKNRTSRQKLPKIKTKRKLDDLQNYVNDFHAKSKFLLSQLEKNVLGNQNSVIS